MQRTIPQAMFSVILVGRYPLVRSKMFLVWEIITNSILYSTVTRHLEFISDIALSTFGFLFRRSSGQTSIKLSFTRQAPPQIRVHEANARLGERTTELKPG